MPVKPLGPVKVIPLKKRGKRTIRGMGYCKLHWYRCDNCGEIFNSGNRGSPRGMHGFCRSDCEKEFRSKYQTGRPHSEDHKRKIGESMLGKPRSEETKKKLSRSRKKLYQNPEYKERMRRETWDNPVWREKISDGKRGLKNPNWKGGPSARKREPTPADLYRNTKEWREKSNEIRERDSNTCVECGSQSEDGTGHDVHHSYPLNDWINDGHDPSDYPDEWLMTLDKSCHSKSDMSDGVFKYPPRAA